MTIMHTQKTSNISDEFDVPTGDTLDFLVPRVEIASWPTAVVSLRLYDEHLMDTSYRRRDTAVEYACNISF